MQRGDQRHQQLAIQIMSCPPTGCRTLRVDASTPHWQRATVHPVFPAKMMMAGNRATDCLQWTMIPEWKWT